MARSLIQALVASAPESIRRKAQRARRARPVKPSHRAELNYLADLLVIVEHCTRAGAEIGAGLKVHWDEFVPASDARKVGDAPPPPPGAPAEAPGLNVLLEQAARRFGNIEGVADRLAKLAAQRTLGAVDEALAESILRAVGVDISSYLAPDTEIGAALREGVAANVELIKSIPTQYLDAIRDTVSTAFAKGERFESVVGRIAHIGEVTKSRAELIAQDQIAKLTSKFNEVRQTSVGITHYVWSTSHDERVRPSHAAVNGETFAWKSPPEIDGEHVNPGEAVRCFPGDSEIQFAHDVKKAYRRRYSGELAEIVTESGKTLRATPNHPVLTTRGWLPIGQLNKGDHVIEVADEVFNATKEHRDDGVPSIAQVFSAASAGHPAQSIHLRIDDFHGDGSDGDVDVVFAARPLVIDHVTSGAQGIGEFPFTVAVNGRSRQGMAAQLLFAVLHAANRIVGGAREFLAILWRQATHPQQLCFASAPTFDAGFTQAPFDHVALDAQSPRDRQFAFAGHVGIDDGGNVDSHPIRRMASYATVGLHADGAQSLRQGVLAGADDLGGHAERLPFGHQASRVVKARRFDWSGHVFNLETAAGWYVTNGIVAHNCRCVGLPVIDLGEQTGGGEEKQAA